MSARQFLDRWRSTGAITDDQHDALAALARQDRFSLFVELNVLLYVGVLAVAGGTGWTIAAYSARVGDLAILATLSAVFAGSLYYCFTRTPPYSHQRVEAPGLSFDYVLYLGCLIFAAELAYAETRFHPFGAAWDQSLLIAAAVFFALAYRFDNRFVLSLALSSLAGWFGVEVGRFALLSAGALRGYALGYGTLVAASGALLHRAGIKRHFLETYLHVAAHVLFLALLSGVGGAGGGWPAYLIAVVGLAAVSIVQGVKADRFVFVVYGVVYGYAGISLRVLREVSSFSGGLAYLAFSGTIVILALVGLARRFGREE